MILNPPAPLKKGTRKAALKKRPVGVPLLRGQGGVKKDPNKLKSKVELNNNNKTQNTMKKLIMTTAIVLGLAMTSFAQGGGMFHRANSGDNGYALYEKSGDLKGGGFPGLPGHNETGDADAPLGSGIVLLTTLGAAYMVAKKRREE